MLLLRPRSRNPRPCRLPFRTIHPLPMTILTLPPPQTKDTLPSTPRTVPSQPLPPRAGSSASPVHHRPSASTPSAPDSTFPTASSSVGRTPSLRYPWRSRMIPTFTLSSRNSTTLTMRGSTLPLAMHPRWRVPGSVPRSRPATETALPVVASSPARRIYGRLSTRSSSTSKLATAIASSRPGRSRRPSCRAGCPARGSSIATSRRGRRRP
mmetsp:Transcript_8789/g.18878  ORF Transcript_8789/g.18878 Transcript_8789/m.18878 type:complete len:210 (-) Transcript_8789:1544-2173(-)